jgi:hypothetical protein
MTRVAIGGTDAFVAWEDVQGTEQVLVARVAQDGSFSSHTPVGAEEHGASWPALAWTGAHLAAATYQFRDGTPAVFVALMTRMLSRVDELEVSGGAAARYPDIAWTGEALGVAYAENGGGVRMTRIQCTP